MSQINEFWRNGFRYFTIDLGDGEARMCLSQCKNLPVKNKVDPVAYGVSDVPYGKIFYLDFIRVSTPYRGKGHGSELLKACLRWADATNNIIILDAIPLEEGMDCFRLVRFYLDHGFKLSKYKGSMTAMYYHQRRTKRVRKLKELAA